MSGALLQLLVRGEHDVHLQTDSRVPESWNPFKQRFKKVTPFSEQMIQVDASYTSERVYGTNIRINVPRKGDLLKGITLAFRVKKSGTSFFPVEELVREATLTAGRQEIERITGDWIRASRSLYEDSDQTNARYRLEDFNVIERPGAIKTLFLDLPFFFNHLPLPMVAIQQQNIEINVVLAERVDGLDPFLEPEVQIYGHYVFLDDHERRWLSKTEHAFLIERLQIQKERVQLKQTTVSIIREERSLETNGEFTFSVEGQGSYDDVFQNPNNILLVGPTWPGETRVVVDAGIDSSEYLLGINMLIPIDPTSFTKLFWARGKTSGYTATFQVRDNKLEIEVRREKDLLVRITNIGVEVYRDTVVSGSGTNTDISKYLSYGEFWIDFDLVHDLGCPAGRLDCSYNQSTIQLTYKFRAYSSISGAINGEEPQEIETRTLEIREGESPLNATGMTTFGFSASSQTTPMGNPPPVYANDFRGSTISAVVNPVTDNFTHLNSELLFTGPVRYIAWATTETGDRKRHGAWTPGPQGVMVDAYDIMHSAQILFNGKERTAMLPSSYYSVYEPLHRLKRPLPAGLHIQSFCLDPTQHTQPDGYANFSQIAKVQLHQRYKSWKQGVNDVWQGTVDDTECLENGQNFNDVHIWAITWNILRITGGEIGLAFV